MRPLSARLFGGLELRTGDGVRLAFPTRRSRSLFAFLALEQGRLFSRDFLCGILWEESTERAAKKGLRTALWRIRQVVDSSPVDPDRLIHSDGTSIGIPGDDHLLWVDVHAFKTWIRLPIGPRKPDLAPGHRDSLERAVGLYRGDLLEGLYDRWCCEERQRIRLDFLAALERLMRHYAGRGEWRRAISRGSELLRRDPFREHVHRELMRCHYAMGNRPAAIRQFRECAGLLQRELDIEPMAETRALYDLIRTGRALPETGPLAAPPLGPEPLDRLGGSPGPQPPA